MQGGNLAWQAGGCVQGGNLAGWWLPPASAAGRPQLPACDSSGHPAPTPQPMCTRCAFQNIDGARCWLRECRMQSIDPVQRFDLDPACFEPQPWIGGIPLRKQRVTGRTGRLGRAC